MLTSPIVCILGPTAAGKTAAALALAKNARRVPIEIISVDSALVYQGMDIGTAKPTAAERATAPHHLIDITDPLYPYSTGQFRTDALALIDAILARDHQPLLVGGTMLYYRALAHGLNALPPANPALRAALNAEAVREGWPALHARLAQYDPETAARLAPHDAQRIQRALEIWMLTHSPMSAWLASPRLTGINIATATPPRRFVAITLEPSNRTWLHERIAQRVDAMLSQGLVDEVARLHARGDLHAGLPSMRCVGYRQVWEYLDGVIDYATMRERAIFATRQLAKRQLTWLRSISSRTVIDCCAEDAIRQVVAAVKRIWRGAV